MTKLKRVQNQLLEDIFSDNQSSEFDAAGLAVYRANLRATAAQALKITFPTVKDLIGEPLLDYAAEQLLLQHPPFHGDWARWGAQLPDLLAQLDALKEYPFVPMCARLDFHIHQLIRQFDAEPDHTSFALLEAYEPDQLTLNLAPGLLLMDTEYPVAAIRKAHQLTNAQDTAEAIQTALLDNSDRHYLACFRDGPEVRVDALSKDDYLFTKALQQHSLGSALNTMKDSRFSFQQWLLQAVQSNLLLNVKIYTPSK